MGETPYSMKYLSYKGYFFFLSINNAPPSFLPSSVEHLRVRPSYSLSPFRMEISLFPDKVPRMPALREDKDSTSKDIFLSARVEVSY